MRWSRAFAYALGLIATDGCLSKDQRHLSLVSKDIEQIKTFAKALKLNNKISSHTSSYNPSGSYFHLQFGNVRLYRFLISIGITSNKTHTINEIKIPLKYLADFLRGHLDGDGNISIVKHPESQHPQLRLRFSSTSTKHLQWIKTCIIQKYKIEGGFISKPTKSTQCLVYSKRDAIKLLEFIYYDGVKYYLQRKYNYYMQTMGEWRNWYTRTA